MMNCLIRLVADELHPFEIAFFRNLFGLLSILPFALASGFATFQARRPGRLLLAALVNLFSMMANFSALALIPLNEFTALSFTQPLFQTVGAALILGEAVRRWRWAGTLIGFLGVLIVMRPGTEAFTPASLLALFGASTYAAVALIMKQASNESSITAVLYVSFMISCLSLPVAATVWSWPSAYAMAVMAAIGALGTIGWLAFAYAFKLADASAIAPYDFMMRLPFIAVPAYLIFGEVPDPWAWVGAAVIFASSAFVTRAEVKRAG